MEYYIESIINLLMFLLPVLSGIKKYKSLEFSLKIFLVFAIGSFIGELIAFFAAILFKNNLPVYNIFGIINLTAITLYFKESLPNKLKTRMNMLVGINFIIWVLTLFAIHSIISINSSFLAYQGLLVIGLSIYLMEIIVSQQSRTVFNLRSSPNFIIAFLLMVYWCFSIMQWILYRFFTNETFGFQYLDLSLTIINIVINFCFAMVFLYYPKKCKKNDF